MFSIVKNDTPNVQKFFKCFFLFSFSDVKIFNQQLLNIGHTV